MSTTPQDTAKAGFSVMIVACGPYPNGGGLVCAIVVTQPVQSWTVIRTYDEFRAMGNVLSPLLPTLPPCPTAVAPNPDVDAIVQARNELQEWLLRVLMYPGSREVPTVRNFLILEANMIPPQYNGVSWTQFSPILPPPAAAPAANLDDMDMEDMYHHDEEAVQQDEDHEEDDDDYVPLASERYRQMDEAVTDADEMEIMDLAGEVEMVEDIGSLAQSMGASHLGRSLQLQAEMKHPQSRLTNPSSEGLQIGGAANGDGGGLGGAMARALADSNTNTAFHSKPIQSAPRLDSFKLVKVIGKGSFGK